MVNISSVVLPHQLGFEPPGTAIVPVTAVPETLPHIAPVVAPGVQVAPLVNARDCVGLPATPGLLIRWY
jgi:hypothetical protein